MHPSGSVLQIESYKIRSETLCRALHDKVFFVSHHTGLFLSTASWYSVVMQSSKSLWENLLHAITAQLAELMTKARSMGCCASKEVLQMY